LVQKSGAVAPSVPAGKAGKAKKTPKARDPSAPPKAPNSWILFTSRVRSVINESGVLGEKKLGKECTQFCSSMKEENAELDSWTAETILARFSGWTVPEKSKQSLGLIKMPTKKNKGSEAAAPESEAAAEPAAVSEKPKRVISQEQKDKMRAGRERAAAAKKAAAAGSAPVAVAVAETPAPVAAAPAPVSEAEAEEEAEEWMPMKLRAGGVFKHYLWNPTNNHCYNRDDDGGQGEWAGIFNPKTKTIDSSVPEPSEEEDFEVLDA
jgi:hypothetical protein